MWGSTPPLPTKKAMAKAVRCRHQNSDLTNINFMDNLRLYNEVRAIPEAAVFCKVAKQTVYNRVKEGTLHIVQRGCRSGILKSELTAIKR
jgi:hypothetical protein